MGESWRIPRGMKSRFAGKTCDGDDSLDCTVGVELLATQRGLPMEVGLREFSGFAPHPCLRLLFAGGAVSPVDLDDAIPAPTAD